MNEAKTETVPCGGYDVEVSGLFTPANDDGPSVFRARKARLVLPNDERIDVTEMMKYLDALDILEELAYERIDEDDDGFSDDEDDEDDEDEDDYDEGDYDDGDYDEIL